MSSVQWHLTKNNPKTNFNFFFFFFRFTGKGVYIEDRAIFYSSYFEWSAPFKYSHLNIYSVWQIHLHARRCHVCLAKCTTLCFRIHCGVFQRTCLAVWHSCELWLWKIVTHHLRWAAVLSAPQRFFFPEKLHSGCICRQRARRADVFPNQATTHAHTWWVQPDGEKKEALASGQMLNIVVALLRLLYYIPVKEDFSNISQVRLVFTQRKKNALSFFFFF